MTINELRTERTKLLLDAQTVLLNSPDSEKRASANKMLADADVLEQDLAHLDRIAKVETEERSRTTPGRPNPSIESADQKAADEKRAFSDYIRYGIKSPILQENRTGITVASGAALIPLGMYGLLTESQKYYGTVLNEITTQDVDSGQPVKIAYIDDSVAGLTEVGDAGAITEQDPNAIGGFTMTTNFFTTGLIKVTLMQLNQSNWDLDSWIVNAFGKRVMRGASNLVTNGSTSGDVQSLKTAATVGATTAGTGTITYTDIVNLYASLDPAYSQQDAKFSCNQAVRAQLLSVLDSLGRPIFTPSVTSDQFDRILGHDVFINPFLDPGTTSGNVSMLFGTHKSYLLRTVKPGLAIARLNELLILNGEIGFVGYQMMGGGLIQASTSLPPIVSLKMK